MFYGIRVWLQWGNVGLNGLLPCRIEAEAGKSWAGPLPWLQITSDGASSHALSLSSSLQGEKK